jgi:hypothetical protein
MASRLLFSGLRRAPTALGLRASVSTPVRRMGGGHGHGDGIHVPEGYAKIGKFVLVFGWFWIMYRAKENKGQLFGLYYPWLHEHEHTHHHFVEGGSQGDAMPTLVAEHEEEHADHEGGHAEEEEH